MMEITHLLVDYANEEYWACITYRYAEGEPFYGQGWYEYLFVGELIQRFR